ncbi:MAG: helix-turn-helix domain-containing protein [bacterium]
MHSPLAFNPIAATASPEETEHLFTAELADSRILRAEDSDNFGVEMDGVTIRGCDVSFLRHHANYEIDCGVIDDRESVIFGFGCGKASSTSFNGQQLNLAANAVIFTSRATVNHKRVAGSCEVLVKCPASDLKTRLQASLDRTISRELLFKNHVGMDHGIGAHAKSTLWYILNSLNANPTLLENPLIVANFEDLMLNVVLSMPSNYSDELLASGDRKKAPALVSRAEEYMEASASLPITMTDVLLHTGGSRKALLTNFRKYRGYSPGEFLINARLKLAHQRLNNPTNEDSVTSIACDSGFSHLGRFSEIYRKRYGVRPSDTLKQAFRDQ